MKNSMQYTATTIDSRNDNLIIGTVNVQEIRDGREIERNELSTTIQKILAMSEIEALLHVITIKCRLKENQNGRSL